MPSDFSSVDSTPRRCPSIARHEHEARIFVVMRFWPSNFRRCFRLFRAAPEKVIFPKENLSNESTTRTSSTNPNSFSHAWHAVSPMGGDGGATLSPYRICSSFATISVLFWLRLCMADSDGSYFVFLLFETSRIDSAVNVRFA